ncbi:unnamed protein product [Urochloa humidicola]
MEEQSRSEFHALLQRLRSAVHAHVTRPSVVDHQLTGGGNAFSPRDHNGLPGHLQDLVIHSTQTSSDDCDDDGWYSDNYSDESYDEVHEEDLDDLHTSEPEGAMRVTQMLIPGSIGYIDEIMEFDTRLRVPEDDDILEQIYQGATDDGRLSGPPELDQPDSGFGGIPACAEVVAGLEKHKYNGSGGDNECPTCMMDYAIDDVQSMMPCKHRFHQKCLAKWLSLSHLCPLCRHVLPVEKQDVQ